MIFSCLIHDLQAQSKVTLKKFDDPQLSSGYKSIVFEYEEGVPNQRGGKRTVIKEFDIEENNPFLKMGFEVGKTKYGALKLNIDPSSLQLIKSQFGVSARNIRVAPSEKVEFGMTHTFCDIEKNNVLLSYNLFLYDENEEHIDEERFASILILDRQGNITDEVENIPTDAYGTNISENGKYLAYGYGEHWHSTLPGSIKSGFRIIDLETGQLFFEFETGFVECISSCYDMLVVGCINEKGRQKMILDAKDGSIYGPVKFDLIKDRFRFMQTNGTIIEFESLPKFR